MHTIEGFYEIRTFGLAGANKVDVLTDPASVLWVPGQQLAALTGDGMRADGLYSTSDMSWALDRAYVRRVADPGKIYTKTRAKSTTLFAVAGLVQKACHTAREAYFGFSREFIATVLPAYPEFVARHAELIELWAAAVAHGGHGFDPGGLKFHAAVAARDARLLAAAESRPESRPEPGPEPRPEPARPAGPGVTAEDVRQAVRQLLQDELPGIVRPIVLEAVKAQPGPGAAPVIDLVRIMADAAGQLAGIAEIHRDQLVLSRQTIELITPNHQLFLTAREYVEMDGVAEALKRAPALAEPSLGLDRIIDHGKASLWMKRLCREEKKKVAANAVARIIAEDAGLEPPPIYIPAFRMKRLEREHAKVLMFSPPCWARLKQTFLPQGTPTLLFPGPKVAAPPAGAQEG
jgi:hypothetical protein